MTNVKDAHTYLNYMNGQWLASSTGEVSASISPANKNEVVGYFQMSTLEELNTAVESAADAQKKWKKLSGGVRGDYLFKAANVMESRIDEIAETMTREMGKTFPEAKGETARGIAILRYYAGEGLRSIGDVIPSSDSSALLYTTRVPLGVVGVITPWNFPSWMPSGRWPPHSSMVMRLSLSLHLKLRLHVRRWSNVWQRLVFQPALLI